VAHIAFARSVSFTNRDMTSDRPLGAMIFGLNVSLSIPTMSLVQESPLKVASAELEGSRAAIAHKTVRNHRTQRTGS
jgi:hypothetical protein